MSNFFSLNNPVWNFLGKLTDVFVLTVFWFVCSIPIVTIGASSSAMYYCCLKLTRDEEGYIYRQFFKAFKDNLGKGIIIGVLMLLFGGILGFNLWFYMTVESSFSKPMFVIMLMFLWAYLMVLHYVFAVQAQFENTIKNTLLFSFALAIRKLGWTVIMLSVTVLIVVGGFTVFLPLLLLAPGLVPFINSYILNRCFKPYLEAAEEESAGEGMTEE